jgi:hypothetical protein
MRRVAKLGNVVPFGQQGLFLHAGLDRRADLAEAAVAHVAAGSSATSWIDKAEAYLKIRAPS